MKIGLVGGAGQIGVHLSQEMLRQNIEVTVFDINPENAPVLIKTGVHFIQGDVNKKYRLFQKVKDCDCLVNMASIYLGYCFDFPRKEVEAAVIGTLNCIELANKLRIPFIYISTSEVYGEQIFPAGEETPCHPQTPYAAIKLAGELVTQTSSDDFLIIRPFNTYGPFAYENKHSNIITKAILAALSGTPLEIYNSLKNVRDWTYVTDMAKGILYAVVHYNLFKPVVNICSEKPHTVLDVVYAVEKVSGNLLPLLNRGKRRGDLKSLLGNCIKFRSEANWHPTFSLEQGISEYYHWRRLSCREY